MGHYIFKGAVWSMIDPTISETHGTPNFRHQMILDDGEFKSGDDVLVLVNGCGATTLMELFILYNRLDEILKERNISTFKPLIGNYVTTQEMAGFSLSMAPANAEIKRLWAQPANTPFFKVMG